MTWLDEVKARLQVADVYVQKSSIGTDLDKAIRIIECYEKALEEIAIETETNTNFSRAEDEAEFYIDIAKAALAQAEAIKGGE
jgi:hypothetical protein